MAKRRPSGDGMVRKRDDGRWEGRIVVGHKENGDPIFRYVYADTQKELTAKLRRQIDAYQGADLTERSGMTLAEWLDQWLEDIAGTIRPTTLARYSGAVRNHIKPQIGDRVISRVTPKDIQKLYDRLARNGNITTGAGLSSGTIRGIHNMLHEALAAAEAAHLMIRNPTEGLAPPKLSAKPKQILTEEQLDRFRCKDPVRHPGPQQSGVHTGYLHPHHWRYAKAGGGDRRDISDRYLWRGVEAMGRKRKNGEGTVRLRKDGRWEGRVVVGYDEKGLPKTKNVLAKTKGECVEKLAALKASVGAPTPGKAKPDMPFGAWADLWFETYYKPYAKPSTQRISEGFIRLYLKPRLGHIPLNKLTANDLQQFYVWMKNDGRTRERDSKGEGLSDNMLQNCHYLCRRVLEKAVAEGLIHQDPAAHCKLPSMTRAEMRILTREEMQKTLIQAKEEGYYEVFLLEFATGLREGELAALQWDDLNFQTGELRISRQAGRVIGSGIVISEPKTIHSIRTLVLPPITLQPKGKKPDLKMRLEEKAREVAYSCARDLLAGDGSGRRDTCRQFPNLAG